MRCIASLERIRVCARNLARKNGHGERRGKGHTDIIPITVAAVQTGKRCIRRTSFAPSEPRIFRITTEFEFVGMRRIAAYAQKNTRNDDHLPSTRHIFRPE